MSDQMQGRRISIGWMYPEELSTYGDRGNVLALVKRGQWRGMEVHVVRIRRHDVIPTDVDILFIGGGQDRAQAKVAQTLVRTHGSAVRDRLCGGIALLAICGGYQLLCHEYVTLLGERIPGVGIFDAMTQASTGRLVGDVALRTRWGTVVGFENHSGRTYLGAGVEPLGRVESGHGNNGFDGTEGVVSGRAVGSYLHGALLPRNPDLTDWLLLEGIRRTDPAAALDVLPNVWELETHLPFSERRSGRSHTGRRGRTPGQNVPTGDARDSAAAPDLWAR
jgi:lipid II isoglutaminyl synthase (glutamine-hydrolysing)